jgi:hypothetical protein
MNFNFPLYFGHKNIMDPKILNLPELEGSFIREFSLMTLGGRVQGVKT